MCKRYTQIYIIIQSRTVNPLFIGPGPKYSIDLSSSEFTSQTYDLSKGQHSFNVEQGTRFYLKLNQNTYQRLSDNDVELYRDHQHLPQSPNGTIALRGDSIGIPSVDKRYEGEYTIKASNGAHLLSFQLNVTGNEIMSSIQLK